MDILSIFKIVAPLAPVAASIAGGMVAGPAGALAASKLTSIIMGKFGVDPTSPTATTQLSDRIAEAGEETARAKINAAMEQARAEIAGFVEVEKSANEMLARSVAQTNETMRAEADNRVKLALAGIKEHWFFSAWRPFFGWVFGGNYAVFGIMLSVVTAKTAWASPDPLTVLRDAWPIFLSYFGPGGLILGVLIPSRSIEKKAAIENAAPMPNARPAAPPPPPKVLPTEPVRGPMPPVKPTLGPRPTIDKPAGSRD